MERMYKFNEKFFDRCIEKEFPMTTEYRKAIEARQKYYFENGWQAEFTSERKAVKYLQGYDFKEVLDNVFKKDDVIAYVNRVSNTILAEKTRTGVRKTPYYLISYWRST